MINYQDFFAERAQLMQASDIREAFKLTENADIISFAGGFPSAEYFPVQEVEEIVSELLASSPGIALQYGPTEGIAELRCQVAELMSSKGVRCSGDQVLITSGSQQALDLIGRVFLNPGDLVLMETPGYIGALGALKAYQPIFEGVPLDEDGLRVDVLAQRLEELASEGKSPKLLYTVATFHNPTGVTMSMERRRHLVRLAEKYRFLIVEDNPYEEIFFEGEPVSSIKSLDTSGLVIYLGSFSKIFLPGLRVGWVTAERSMVEKLAIAKQSMDLCGSTLGQKIVSTAIKRGFFSRHIPALRFSYRKKRDVMLTSLERFAPEGVVWTRPQGGFFVWLTLPERMDAKVILSEAIHKKVAYVCGSGFHLDGGGHNTIRLAFSQNTEEQIREGVRRLCLVLKENLGGREVGVARAV